MRAFFAPTAGLMTLRGEIPAADLRPGDMILTLSGQGPALKPLRHVGRQALPHAPVLLREGAIAPGMPARDLLLTPGHAVRAGGDTPVPVATLANGATVTRLGAVPEWIALALAAPDIVLAEGLAVALGGDFPPDPAATDRVRDRAFALGWTETADPALCVSVGGQVIPYADGMILPAGHDDVRLLSRHVVPEEIDPAIPDARRLGVALTGLALDGDAVPLDDPRLAAGFLPPESGLRWTDGAGVLALDRPRAMRLSLALRPIWTRYWRAPQR